MNVAAIIVTRGDQDLTPILTSLPEEWERIVWDNGAGVTTSRGPDWEWTLPNRDLSVYGRYAAIERTDAELIYVQDDDCVVSDPAMIVRAWEGTRAHFDGEHVVCNQPEEFRHEFYEEHALVGFGAVFHRDVPERAFQIMPPVPVLEIDREWMWRTCDIIVTGLTPRVLVDVPYENLPWADHETRMWKQPGHLAERVRMLDLVRQVAAA